jgi:hypothetical protein
MHWLPASLSGANSSPETINSGSGYPQPVRYGFIITGGPVHEQVELARAAEEAGWDGVFTWDGVHVGDDIEAHDPWALMAAFAGVTSRVILGAVDDAGVTGFGEPQERRVRAERLDESLEILTGLWTGQPYEFHGRHHDFPKKLAFRPTPVQRPRIPIWVVGMWPRERSMQRVIRYDGFMPDVMGADGTRRSAEPEDLREMRDWIAERRSIEGFEIVAEGKTPPDDRMAAAAEVKRWSDAGATWWLESDWENFAVEPQRRRIEAGPPRVG